MVLTVDIDLDGGSERVALDGLVLRLADEATPEVPTPQLEPDLVPARTGAILLLEWTGFPWKIWR